MVQDGNDRQLVKAKYGNDFRRAFVPRGELEQYGLLDNWVRKLYSISDDDVVLVKYLDSDGDLISLTNDADINVALRTERNLTFHVFTSGEDLRADVSRLQNEFVKLKDLLDKVSLTLEDNVAHFDIKQQEVSRLSSPLIPSRHQEQESIATIEPSRHEQVDNGVSHLVSAAESASAVASESAQFVQEDFGQQNAFHQQQEFVAPPPVQPPQEQNEFGAPPLPTEFQQPPPLPSQQQPSFQEYQPPQQFQQPPPQQPLESIPIDQGVLPPQQFQQPPNGFGAPPQGFGVPPPTQVQQFSAPPQGFGAPPTQPPFTNGISSPPSVDGRVSIPPPQQFQQGPPQGFAPPPSQPSVPGTPHHFQQPPLNKSAAPSPFPGSQFGPPPTSQFGPPPTAPPSQYGAPPSANGPQFGAPPPSANGPQFGAPPSANGPQFGAPPTFPGQQPGGAPPSSQQPPLGPPPTGLPIGPPPTFAGGPPTGAGLPNPFARQGQQFPPRPQFNNY